MSDKPTPQQELRAKNWREHYNSLKQNINDASSVLGDILFEVDKKIEETDSLDNLLLDKQKDIAEAEATRDTVFFEIEHERTSFRKESEKIASDRKTFKFEETKSKEAVREILKDVKLEKVHLSSLRGEVSKEKLELSSLDPLRKEVVSLKEKKKILETKSMQIRRGSAREKKEKEQVLLSIQKMLQKTKEELFKKQRGIDLFKEGILETRKRLLQRGKTLNTYESRLRNLYKNIGIPLKALGNIEVEKVNV